MPTKRIAIQTSGQTIFTTPKHEVGRFSSIKIEGKGAEATIIVQDMFSGDVSAGVTSPTVNSSVVHEVTVRSGELLTYNAEDLQDIRTFGIVNTYASVVTSGIIVFAYHFD